MARLPDSDTDRMAAIARYIERHAEEPLRLNDLGELAGLSPSRLQKTFKQVFGLSPKAYQDSIRMRRLKSELKQGSPVTDAIYSAGFGSVSRFYGEPSRQVGMSASAYRERGEGESIVHACRKTVAGWLMLAATDRGICFAEFGDGPEALLDQLKTEFPRAHFVSSRATQSPEMDEWMTALDTYLSSRGPRPDLPLDLRGTAFQMQVWRYLLSIQEGDTISYSQLAEGIGRPRSVRAVASACGRNRVAVLVPCHRVLRSDGGLGGYRWGLERKRRFLENEQSLVRKKAESSQNV
ncbi:methylated-DNA--[protein]-cysteine S-methyltransferase [Marinobacter sp. CHS3-4]|uniref:bifunctional transcriptional activator/DNA repair enzyme AdaA n=1 Tax=Marinobacter sp. CHS3-4 TaxID=3045174 RepID=UPI0024B5284F|nr:methylated-DNA--[protein]-cysteine S-methyltransferase [Marinobacter sp. CHS3-4]MDI9244335.1 methylated-DNA--[protein]-cysteine S-methyltransferase [Marinobacter sp. CHS3-4]